MLQVLELWQLQESMTKPHGVHVYHFFLILASLCPFNSRILFNSWLL